ncbi:MAG: FAD-dependent monooxygenase [Thermoanaerobaculia bacterium]
MRIVCLGGGPAGLYFALLMKKRFPQATLRVIERNRPDDTFGWGVVFSDETLGTFEQADPESYRRIQEGFRSWRDIETWYRDTCVRSTGHGFAALSRKVLLEILQRRCREVGVELVFEREVRSVEPWREWDLVVGSDGVNSTVRTELADVFRPTLDWRECKFCWLGTDKELEAFTFIFRESEHGLFQVHAYPFAEGLGTWIVECREEVWRAAGLDRASEEDTVAYCEELFASELDGHRLLTNRSLWRTFPTVRCESWVHENVVLLGDAAHTAHFSIGSGTKLAMEDAVALAEAFTAVGLERREEALERYVEARWVDVAKLQKAAQTGLEWFDPPHQYLDQARYVSSPSTC